MCDLTGIHDRDGAPVGSAALPRMREHMHTRSPDDAVMWFDPRGGIELAHRRLGILDLSAAGAQPMVTFDGRYHAVGRDEIYKRSEEHE